MAEGRGEKAACRVNEAETAAAEVIGSAAQPQEKVVSTQLQERKRGCEEPSRSNAMDAKRRVVQSLDSSFGASKSFLEAEAIERKNAAGRREEAQGRCEHTSEIAFRLRVVRVGLNAEAGPSNFTSQHFHEKRNKMVWDHKCKG